MIGSPRLYPQFMPVMSGPRGRRDTARSNVVLPMAVVGVRQTEQFVACKTARHVTLIVWTWCWRRRPSVRQHAWESPTCG